MYGDQVMNRLEMLLEKLERLFELLDEPFAILLVGIFIGTFCQGLMWLIFGKASVLSWIVLCVGMAWAFAIERRECKESQR